MALCDPFFSTQTDVRRQGTRALLPHEGPVDGSARSGGAGGIHHLTQGSDGRRARDACAGVADDEPLRARIGHPACRATSLQNTQGRRSAASHGYPAKQPATNCPNGSGEFHVESATRLSSRHPDKATFSSRSTRVIHTEGQSEAEPTYGKPAMGSLRGGDERHRPGVRRVMLSGGFQRRISARLVPARNSAPEQTQRTPGGSGRSDQAERQRARDTSALPEEIVREMYRRRP